MGVGGWLGGLAVVGVVAVKCKKALKQPYRGLLNMFNALMVRTVRLSTENHSDLTRQGFFLFYSHIKICANKQN